MNDTILVRFYKIVFRIFRDTRKLFAIKIKIYIYHMNQIDIFQYYELFKPIIVPIIIFYQSIL